jgi:hypothetical protein
MLSFARRFNSRALHTHSATARSASTVATASSRRPSTAPSSSSSSSSTTTSSKASTRVPLVGTKASRLAAQVSLQKRGALPGHAERVKVAATLGDKGARTAQLVASGVSSHGSAVRLVVLQRGSKLHAHNALTANAVRQIDAELRKFAGDSLAQSIVIQSEREKEGERRRRRKEREEEKNNFFSFSRFSPDLSRFSPDFSVFSPFAQATISLLFPPAPTLAFFSPHSRPRPGRRCVRRRRATARSRATTRCRRFSTRRRGSRTRWRRSARPPSRSGPAWSTAPAPRSFSAARCAASMLTRVFPCPTSRSA